jgi:hypothetical protein
MSEQRHAPGWRGRPKTTGPLLSDLDRPRWIEFLEAIAPVGCAAVGILSLIIAAYAWAADFLAGHL